MANVKRVAEEAAVSVATVSRVLNGSGFVSPDLRARVHTAVDALNYRPSLIARSLRTQQTSNIGVLIPQIDHPFFGVLTFSVEKALFEEGYRCFVCSTEEDASKEEAYIEALLAQQVNGLIVVPTASAEEGVQKFLQKQTPIVLIDRDLPRIAVDRVSSDNFSGAHEVASHLIGLGHRRVSVIGTSARSRAIRDRVAGIEKAFAELADTHELQIHFQEPLAQFEAGYESGKRLLRLKDRPTAILALTDVIAVGVLHASAELEIDVPGELSVTGFDDIPLATYVLPALTTVAQPLRELGRIAARLMLEKVANPGRPVQQVVLPTNLVVRRSTAAAN